MKIARFVAYLESLGIRLWLEQNQLRYQAPKNGLTAALRSEILDHKADIMAFLAQANSALEIPIQPVARDANTPIPLSFAQQRLWFLAQLEDVNDVYNIPAEFRLCGPLDVAALRASFRQLEERHEALHTSFPQTDGQAHQQINPPNAPFELIDLAHLPKEQHAVEVTRLARQSANQVFDLAKGPLWRVRLLRLAENSHVLLMPIHHIITDGWSMGILLHELSVLYGQQLGQPTECLPELPIQYADFAVWQRQWLQGEHVQELLAYWKAQLAGAPPLLTLPTDYPRPAMQSDRGNHFYFSVSKPVAQALKQLAQESNATLFMILQAAFALLLARYSGQEDILIGAPIANRPVAETENLIGLFLNALVLRNDLSGNPTFRDFLARVRQVALAAYQRQALPFEMLVETLQPERSLAHSPIFQVMFNLLNNRDSMLSLAGVMVERSGAEYAVAKHDLVLTMQEHEDALVAAMEYSTDLFERDTIARMAGHFQTVLEGIVANPEQPIAHLPLLTATERQQMLFEWNSTTAGYPTDQCYHQLFEAQAAHTPDAVAIIYDSGSIIGAEAAPDAKIVNQLTYREVNERANQLAHYLRELGVGRGEPVAVGAEVIVGVCMERSPETIISLLAIFKAGGVYIPLDPSLPPERLAYMLTKSDACVIFTKRPYATRLADHNAQFVYLDQSGALLDEQPKYNPVNRSTPQNLAYVLFTSGSTGLPKGVMVKQQGMVNNLHAKIMDHQMTAHDKLAQTAPPSFDISIWQFLAALLVGGAVRIFNDETARDPVQLLRRTEAEKITILEVVPSLFRFILDEVATNDVARPDFSALRWLSLTGEALPPNLCNAWFAYYPDIPILNAYGPAECSDDATHYVIDAPLPPDVATVPIGRPLPHVRLYVLDTYMQPVSIGVPGELYIGGIGVGRGYLNDPERTAKAFLADPFVLEPDACMYKTGDAVRYRPDGTLEFLGRLDYQVKLRGFRIELGEIEALLTQHEAVEQAVTAIQAAANGEQQLVAYVTLSQQGEALAEQTQFQVKQVALWHDLHEQSYQEQLLLDEDPTLNVIGWDSNYTNTPLPAVEMREYIAGTVQRALAIRPQRVLEVGCGTGLLAFPLIAAVEAYRGVDISAVAIQHLQRLQADPALQARVAGLNKAIFEMRAADDLTGLEEERFDLVMLPSVVQYFPSADYLYTVLTKLLTLVRAGGGILVSDVRHLGLLEAFHASVQLYKAADDVSGAVLKQRLWQQFQNEREMAIDPAFFVALARALPQITHVEILPKLGRHQNEMTRFRYDVMLHVGGRSAAEVAIAWHDWVQAPLSLAQIEAQLQTADLFGLRRVGNQRVAAALAGLQWIGQGATQETVAQFKQRTVKQCIVAEPGLEPEALWALGCKTGHRVVLSLASGEMDGAFDVLFGRALVERVTMPAATTGHKAWWQYANNPLREQQARTLVPQWRAFLNEHLPNYMVPSQFVLLDTMPLTPNGKIDRQGLPVPDPTRHLSSSGYALPRTPTEEVLVTIWQEVLRVEQVGIRDNFFAIGGHSLLATQVVSQIRQRLHVELPLRRLFEAPTIAELADQLDRMKVSQVLQQSVADSTATREEIAI